MRAWGSKTRLVTIKGILEGGTAEQDSLPFKGISEGGAENQEV